MKKIIMIAKLYGAEKQLVGCYFFQCGGGMLVIGRNNDGKVVGVVHADK